MKQILLLLSSLLLFFSCKSVQYVPVERVSTEVVETVKEVRDSIFLHDSIYVRERGDTVWVDRWHTRYREKLCVDTFLHVRVDSIPQLVPVPEYIEKKLSFWQRTLMLIGAGSLLFMGVKVYRMFKVWK